MHTMSKVTILARTSSTRTRKKSLARFYLYQFSGTRSTVEISKSRCSISEILNSFNKRIFEQNNHFIWTGKNFSQPTYVCGLFAAGRRLKYLFSRSKWTCKQSKKMKYNKYSWENWLVWLIYSISTLRDKVAQETVNVDMSVRLCTCSRVLMK